ncbi:hypothetical protein CWE13_10405 [Aliidiomarina shirensis]|uniref:Transposase n=1 Tax=Aliidiomarina shirensis TaxID=1048642 RepID=A0A432WQE7_9GAMM|nr:hypothetical protein CWE13_10405 [Aliidiomarina shirensis]
MKFSARVIAGNNYEKSGLTETQIIAILKETDAGVKVKEICRERGISSTYYNWKFKYGGIEAFDIKRIKELFAKKG